MTCILGRAGYALLSICSSQRQCVSGGECGAKRGGPEEVTQFGADPSCPRGQAIYPFLKIRTTNTTSWIVSAFAVSVCVCLIFINTPSPGGLVLQPLSFHWRLAAASHRRPAVRLLNWLVGSVALTCTFPLLDVFPLPDLFARGDVPAEPGGSRGLAWEMKPAQGCSSLASGWFCASNL